MKYIKALWNKLFSKQNPTNHVVQVDQLTTLNPATNTNPDAITKPMISQAIPKYSTLLYRIGVLPFLVNKQ